MELQSLFFVVIKISKDHLGGKTAFSRYSDQSNVLTLANMNCGVSIGLHSKGEFEGAI